MSKQKEYYSIDEVAELLGKHKATIWDRVKVLEIETHKFRRDRKTYISSGDVERIKAVLKDKPWLAGPDEGKQQKASKEAA